MQRLAVLALSLLSVLAVASPASSQTSERWWGHDFVFCFISDDGTLCNLGWAEQGLANDFRFTIAVNIDRSSSERLLSLEQLDTLATQGFEIANHTSTHCNDGMVRCTSELTPPDCDAKFGDLRGYFADDGTFESFEEAMSYFSHEIDNTYLASLLPSLEPYDIRTAAYPRHGHAMAVTDSLVARGYLGARAYLGVMSPYYSDYTTEPHNSWEDGISMYRVPVLMNGSRVFGDHSADPPVHYDYETFVAEAQPFIDEMRASGGIMTMTTHTFGDDDDTYDVWAYGAGGITPQELGWIVELVRANGGVVKTLGEAVAYYRERSEVAILDGDYVWELAQVVNEDPEIRPDPLPLPARTALTACRPNPFNPTTEIGFAIPRGGRVRVDVHDLRGRLVRPLVDARRSAGEYAAVWDGCDVRGRRMESGSYVVVVRFEDERDTRLLSLVK